MKRQIFFAIVAAAALLAPAFAQVKPTDTPAPPSVQLADPVTIKVTRQQLLLIGQGLQELPAKVANPLLNELQAQLKAADEAAAKVAPKPADQKAE